MTRTELNVLGALILILACLTGSLYLINQHNEKMATLGYIEVQNIGSTSTHWEPTKVPQYDAQIAELRQALATLVQQLNTAIPQLRQQIAALQSQKGK